MVSINLLEVCTMTMRKAVVVLADYELRKTGIEKPGQITCCTNLPIRVWTVPSSYGMPWSVVMCKIKGSTQ